MAHSNKMCGSRKSPVGKKRHPKVVSVHPATQYFADGYSKSFSIRKPTLSQKVNKIKRLRGGVHGYAAQVTLQIDAEILKKGRFRIETS